MRATRERTGKTMDCATARKRIEERADGLLAPGAEGELEAHLSACASCAAERARTDAVGRLLRARAAAMRVGSALLAALMRFATYNDLRRLFQ